MWWSKRLHVTIGKALFMYVGFRERKERRKGEVV